MQACVEARDLFASRADWLRHTGTSGRTRQKDRTPEQRRLYHNLYYRYMAQKGDLDKRVVREADILGRLTVLGQQVHTVSSCDPVPAAGTRGGDAGTAGAGAEGVQVDGFVSGGAEGRGQLWAEVGSEVSEGEMGGGGLEVRAGKTGGEGEASGVKQGETLGTRRNKRKAEKTGDEDRSGSPPNPSLGSEVSASGGCDSTSRGRRPRRGAGGEASTERAAKRTIAKEVGRGVGKVGKGKAECGKPLRETRVRARRAASKA